jgi:hypothetical protein
VICHQVKYLGSFVVGIPVFVFKSYYQVRPVNTDHLLASPSRATLPNCCIRLAMLLVLMLYLLNSLDASVVCLTWLLHAANPCA